MYINEQIQVFSFALLAVVSFGQGDMVSLRIIPIHKIMLLFFAGEQVSCPSYWNHLAVHWIIVSIIEVQKHKINPSRVVLGFSHVAACRRSYRM